MQKTPKNRRLTSFMWLLKHPSFQLIATIVMCSFFYSHINVEIVRFFFTISTILRELLVFIIPFMLFSFLALSLSSIPKEGFFFVIGIMIFVFISNFINILVSGAVGYGLLHGIHTTDISTTEIVISSLFSFSLPSLVSNPHALLCGVIVGIYNSLCPNKILNIIIKSMHDIILTFMKKIFIPLLPIFVGGFFLKLLFEGKVSCIISKNAQTCIFMCGFLFIYLLGMLYLASGFKTSRAITIMKNTLPATITAFSTMSSAAALPFSLKAAEANTRDKVLSDAVMPLTMNFHMVGDTILIPIMSMLVMLSFKHPLPGVFEFLMFGLFFICNKFAGGGVPSGTIMVTVPVLQQYMGFDDNMIAFIIAFYGIIDPIATAGNVTANNFFVLFLQKIRQSFKKKFNHDSTKKS